MQEVKVEARDRVEEGQVLIGLRSAQQTADCRLLMPDFRPSKHV